jgi:UDP-N-acetylmuramyl pentapeptide phosphotransferase/UDP-N-acetylglucosamine-1-phosphate transferase
LPDNATHTTSNKKQSKLNGHPKIGGICMVLAFSSGSFLNKINLRCFTFHRNPVTLRCDVH